MQLVRNGAGSRAAVLRRPQVATRSSLVRAPSRIPRCQPVKAVAEAEAPSAAAPKAEEPTPAPTPTPAPPQAPAASTQVLRRPSPPPSTGPVIVTGATNAYAATLVKVLASSGVKVVAASDDVDAAQTVLDFAKKYALLDKAALGNITLAGLDGTSASLKALPKKAKLVITDTDAKTIDSLLEVAIAAQAAQVILLSPPAVRGGGGLFGGGGGGAPGPRLSKTEQLVASSGLPYAVVRLAGSGPAKEGSEPAQIAVGPLGTLPATSPSLTQIQGATVLAELLKTGGAEGVVLEAAGSVEASQDAWLESFAKIVESAQENASSRAPAPSKDDSEGAPTFKIGTMSIGRAAEEATQRILSKASGVTKSAPEAISAPVKSLGGFFGSLGSKAKAAVEDIEEEVEEEKEEEAPLAKRSGGLFGFGSAIKKATPPTPPAAAAKARGGRPAAKDDDDDEEEQDSNPLGSIFRTISGTSRQKVTPPSPPARAAPASRSSAAPAKPASKLSGGGLFGFGTKPVQVDEDEEEEEEEVKPKKGSGLFGFGANAKRGIEVEEEEEEEVKPKRGTGFFGFGAKPKQVEVEEEEEEEKPKGSGFFGFGARPAKAAENKPSPPSRARPAPPPIKKAAPPPRGRRVEEDSDEEEEGGTGFLGFLGVGTRKVQVQSSAPATRSSRPTSVSPRGSSRQSVASSRDSGSDRAAAAAAARQAAAEKAAAAREEAAERAAALKERAAAKAAAEREARQRATEERAQLLRSQAAEKKAADQATRVRQQSQNDRIEARARERAAKERAARRGKA